MWKIEHIKIFLKSIYFTSFWLITYFLQITEYIKNMKINKNPLLSRNPYSTLSSSFLIQVKT